MIDQNTCKFCHVNSELKNGQTFGEPIWEHTEWFDSYKQTKERKKIEARIISPETNKPRFQSSIKFRGRFESTSKFKINFCPICGRRLGKGKEKVWEEH